VSRPSPLKMSVGAAWTAWAADGSSTTGSEFLERVSSWIEGTSAQLLRARWRPGTQRPTSAELEGRLRHHLEVVAETGLATYPEALELARQGLIEEIAGGAVPSQDISRLATRPRGRRQFISAEKVVTSGPGTRSSTSRQSGL
jgi:hypothetical protein